MNIGNAFKTHAEQQPEAICLHDGNLCLTREQALQWAEQLAHLLHKQIKPENNNVSLVALLLPRSWAVPLCIIACRLTGLAFLPLDTRSSPTRLQGILDTAQPAAILHFNEHSKLLNILSQAGVNYPAALFPEVNSEFPEGNPDEAIISVLCSRYP